jgi:putative ABC transport system permease protein
LHAIRHLPAQGRPDAMTWIALRMLTGDRQKFIGLIFGIAFSTLLITQQLTIFVNLISRGASAVYNIGTVDLWAMDPASRTTDVSFPMPVTALDKVRSVRGVEWATPYLQSGANIRTPEGDLEGVTLIGVDDSTLIGLPRKLVKGDKSALYEPDAIFVDDVGAERLFPKGVNPIGRTLELNDRRAVIRGVVDTTPSFTSQVLLYTRYSNALSYVPGTRNRMSFVIARTSPGQNANNVANRIMKQTGLKVRTRDEFAADGRNFIIENTGIPVNFGITVALGFVVGIAIVGLTLSLFIRDNIKQFGALKAIGVTNSKIRMMVAAQAGLVGLVGYAIGVLGAVAFVNGSASGGGFFKGFYTPWQIPLITGASIVVILIITGWLALRTVLKTEPASVFR